MNGHKVENIAAVISYIEAHLNEKLDLDTVANAVCYSKYHLHRMFTDTVGITLHDYIQRRQLTEAAKLLVFSEKPIIEIALIAGYELLPVKRTMKKYKNYLDSSMVCSPHKRQRKKLTLMGEILCPNAKSKRKKR